MICESDLFALAPEISAIRPVVAKIADETAMTFGKLPPEEAKIPGTKNYMRFKPHSRSKLTEDERWAIYLAVDATKDIPHKQRGTSRTALLYPIMDQFDIEITTVRRVWREQKKLLDANPEAITNYIGSNKDRLASMLEDK